MKRNISGYLFYAYSCTIVLCVFLYHVISRGYSNCDKRAKIVSIGCDGILVFLMKQMKFRLYKM